MSLGLMLTRASVLCLWVSVFVYLHAGMSVHLLATRAHTHVCRYLCACVSVCVCAWLSWADLCIEARFNEAAETHTRYYSRAQHYSWPNSLSLLLWELLDSFPILWSCIVCVCVCVGMSVFVYVWWLVFLCETVLCIFSPEGKTIDPRNVW